MNLTENQRAADGVSGLYQDLEEQLMANIIRHLRDYGQPIDSDDWQLQKLAEIGKLNKENLQIIARAAGGNEKAMLEMLEAVVQEVLQAQLEPGFAALVRDGLVEPAQEPEKSKNMGQAIGTLRRQARDTLNLCNTTMLYKARDAYKNLVQATTALANEYLGVMNKNAAGVVTGAMSRQEALRRTIKEFAQKGIPAFVDKAGREWTPEAYVNMAMRNTARNVADEMQDARCRDFGVDLVAIDAHAGARPKCAKDQGKIFSLSNKSGYTEDLKGKKIRYYPWKSSSYGEPDGILGINCGHHKFPFIPGVNIQRYFPTEDFDANDKLYRETQVQRALERDVRKQKRECMLFNELDDQEAFEAASVKLKQKEARLKDYVGSHSQLHRRKDREQVVGFDKHISARAVAENKKYVAKYSQRRYNKDGSIVVTDDWKEKDHVSIPKKYRPNAVVDSKETKGGKTQVNRTFYDASGLMEYQVHTGPHGNPKRHPYGNAGEHRHEYTWNEDGSPKSRKTTELTETDRKENSDIL